MEPKGARVGARVRAGEHHTNRRATWHDSKVVGCYGGEEHGAFEVRCSEGGYRLFWPGDLEEFSSPWPSRWRSLLG
jgi:hypothetical protein